MESARAVAVAAPFLETARRVRIISLVADDEPATYLNKEIMDQFRPQLEKFYYNEDKYGTYLEQLGIK